MNRSQHLDSIKKVLRAVYSIRSLSLFGAYTLINRYLVSSITASLRIIHRPMRSDLWLGRNDRIPAVEYSPEKHYYDYCKLICQFLDKYLVLSNKYFV